MSLVLHGGGEMTSGSVAVDPCAAAGHHAATAVVKVNDSTGPAGASALVQWDYSPKSMDGTDVGPASNGAGTCHVVGAESVIGELNGDCSTDETSCSLSAHQAIIKQVCPSALQTGASSGQKMWGGHASRPRGARAYITVVWGRNPSGSRGKASPVKQKTF